MSFLEKVENIDIIAEIDLADPDNIEEEDHNQKLQQLIAEWNLSPAIYAILVQHGFSVEYLKDMSDRSLDDVFSAAKWTGHKYALRQKLVLWPESVLFRAASTSSAGVNPPVPTPIQVPTVATHFDHSKHRLLPTSVTAELLNDILGRNEKGKIVVKYFQKERCLDAVHRKHLAHTVVDYYVANDLYFNLADMGKFAKLIAERFPTELDVFYFNPRDTAAGKKHPSGLIYDRFHNRNKQQFIKKFKSDAETKNNYCLEKNTALKLSEDDITKLSTLRTWLRNNFAPAEELQLKWRESLPLRLRSIINEVDIEKASVLSEWPRILDETGYLLIDADFAHLFGNSEKLFEDWELFKENFFNYVRICDIKDDRSRQLLDLLEKPTLRPDSCDLILCFVFQALIKPTRSSSKKLPTILQAQFDVCCICDSTEEYIDELRTLRQDCEAAKIQLTPRIYAVGFFEHIEAFYVVTGKFEYRLPSLLRCLDVVVKLKHVLDYSFPDSCEVFWCFMTRFFYGIDYKRKSKNSQLLQLFAYLEAHRDGDK